MPPPSKVMALPPDLRARLDALIVENGFSGYAELAEWIAEQGHPMHTATVARHGKDLRRRIDQVRLATEQANALLAAAPDDAGAMADASLRQMQARIFDMMLAAEGGEWKEVAAAARALAEVVRAWLAVRQDRRRMLKETAQAVSAEARKLGVSDAVAAALRGVVEGAES